MGESLMTAMFTYITRFIQLMKISDVIDILIIILLVYQVMKMIRETRAVQLLKGLAIIFLTLPISAWLHLTAVNYILRNTMQIGAFAVVVIFQPELRNMLEHVGRSKVGKILDFTGAQGEETGEEVISEITEAAVNMSKTKTGALIVLERDTALGDFSNKGIRVDSQISAALLENIFVPNTPLHDGAVIIRKGRIYSAACVLPLTNNPNLSRELGTRHRAALGMSEVSDAVIIVVSEETGKISIAINGTLTRNLDAVSLQKAIKRALTPKDAADGGKIRFWGRSAK